MYEEGSIDTEHWEKYAAAPGALLPLRSGFNAPTPVMPFQLPNAFFGISGEGKQDMEYLAGIYSSMQGDTNQTKDMPFKGMLAIDEYGTRRVKYWLKHSIEPALKQVGELVRQYTQSIYTANKIFRIVQPNAITEEKQVEINIPIYNDMGEAIGKYMDYASSRFDIRLIAGSTLPVNRWAYLAELKELLRMGVVDDVAVLSETDIKNKDKIVKAGIKSKVMQGEMEVTRKVAETKANVEKEYSETKHLQNQIRNEGRQYMENEKGKLNELLNSLPLKDKNK